MCATNVRAAKSSSGKVGAICCSRQFSRFSFPSVYLLTPFLLKPLPRKLTGEMLFFKLRIAEENGVKGDLEHLSAPLTVGWPRA